MSYTLFDLTYRVCRMLGNVFEGSATGGSTTTITDTINLLNFYNDDYFNGGTAWILRDNAGAGAAPEGEYSRISDFVKSTGVATLSPALTAAVASGDRYALGTSEFPLDQLIQSINKALEDINIPWVDTSLTTAEDKTEYTVPSAILFPEKIQVYIQRVTGDADDNRWSEVSNWYIQNTGYGGTRSIIFTSQPPWAYSLLLLYWQPHPPLYTFSQNMSDLIPINYIERAGALEMLYWKANQKGVADPEINNRITRLEARVGMMRRMLPEATRNRNKMGSIGLNYSLSELYVQN